MYLALYRKYRSATFDEVISQDHITTTLKNQIATGKLAHAYLFTGSRGTGKTTCAKLMAKAVNCLSPKDGNPCGECEICKAIANGCSDVIEMDAASNNGVDDVRALRDEVMYTPVICKYKVYIIDEVHMMSASAFNALLKTIEEPPAHVIFILATTEIHKVPATIVSRCQQFRFRRIDAYDSSKRLCEIAENEGVTLTEEAAQLISRLSDGGMRDAISLLDQCISVNRNVDEGVVRDTAGVAGTDYLFRLADCIYEKTTAEALIILDELHSTSKDLVLLMEELTGHFRNLCLLASTNMSFALIPAGSGSRNDLARQAQQFTLGEIMRVIDILQDYCSRASRTQSRKTLAEMCFIRLCTPRLDSDMSALSLRLEKLENKVDNINVGTAPQQPPKEELPPPFMMARGMTQKARTKTFDDRAETVVPIKDTEKAVSEIADVIKSEEIPAQDSSADEEMPFDMDTPVAEEIKPAPVTKADEAENEALPSWLFEGGEDNTPPPLMSSDEYGFNAEPVASEDNNGYDPEIPPFDSDEEPPQKASPLIQEPTTDYSYGEPPPTDDGISEKLQLAGEWAEIMDELPMFLQPILKQVKAEVGQSSIVISNYQPFHYEFLRSGDSLDRIRKAAKDVTGRSLVVEFDNENRTDTQDISDPLDVFLEKAKSRGVNIKYKK